MIGVVERVGPYELEGVIGRGAFGEVRRATDRRIGRTVALKLLHPRGQAAEQLLLRFRREVELMARLEHPGICPVLDAGLEGGRAWIAMPFIEGVTLETSLAAGPASDPGERIRLVEAVARALHAAHEVGVVHRDVKPANVMLGEEGPVLLDFGLARDQGQDALVLTHTGDLLGTPFYMSPEQIAGQTVDRRSDVWSLGVVLHEALCGERPFTGPTIQAVFHAIREDEPIGGGRLRDLPRDLGIVLGTAMEKDPARRYASAAAFADDLRRVRDHRPILARPLGPGVRLLRFGRRHPALSSCLLSAVIILAAGLVVTQSLWRRAAGDAERAQRELRSWRRLADARIVSGLLIREPELWPRRESMRPGLEAWLEDARRVLARLPDHRRDLADLRGRALPRNDDDRSRDVERRRSFDPAFHDRLDVQRWRSRHNAITRAFISGERLAAAATIMRDVDELLRTMEADPRLHEAITHRFPDDGLAFRHEVLVRLVHEARRVARSIPRIERRRERAAAIREETIDAPRALWDACTASIARDPRYGGLALAPQVGLLPLGRDRDSGLWEFWAPETGERPPWEGDPSRGRARPVEDSAAILVLIPGGTFAMGSQDEDPALPNYSKHAMSSHGPVHRVALAPFFIGKHELTQAQWFRIHGDRPSFFGPFAPNTNEGVDKTHPVESIHFHDAVNGLHRVGLGLPTEAQWEYAARGGTATTWWTGDERSTLAGAANVADLNAGRKRRIAADLDLDDGHANHAPVGSFRANPFGLHDVIGNVSEWTHDTDASYDVRPRPHDGLRDVPPGDYRIQRGGSFGRPSAGATSAARIRNPATLRGYMGGARAARSVDG